MSYFPLSDDIMRQITELQIGRIARCFADHYDTEFIYELTVVDNVVSRWTEVESGARMSTGSSAARCCWNCWLKSCRR